MARRRTKPAALAETSVLARSVRRHPDDPTVWRRGPPQCVCGTRLLKAGPGRAGGSRDAGDDAVPRAAAAGHQADRPGIAGPVRRLRPVVTASPAELMTVDGLGEAGDRGVEARAGRGVAYDAGGGGGQTRAAIWDALTDYLRAGMGHERTEQFRVLFLDSRNKLIADEVRGAARSTMRRPIRGRWCAARWNCTPRGDPGAQPPKRNDRGVARRHRDDPRGAACAATFGRGAARSPHRDRGDVCQHAASGFAGVTRPGTHVLAAGREQVQGLCPPPDSNRYTITGCGF